MKKVADHTPLRNIVLAAVFSELSENLEVNYDNVVVLHIVPTDHYQVILPNADNTVTVFVGHFEPLHTTNKWILDWTF